MADREEDRRLGERMHGHVQQPGESRDRPAHAEGERDDAHVLDRRVGEQPLDVLLARQEERGHHHRQQAEAHHQVAGEVRAERAVHQHLVAHDRVQRDVEQQPGEHRRDRRRAFGVRVRQPVVQRHQPDLGAVADQQKHERDATARSARAALDRIQMRPQQRGAAAPSTFSAARYSRMVPNSACAMPTPHRMKYFHAASRLAGVRYRLTSSTVASVAASIATHRMPMLLVSSASSMVKVNIWYML